MCGQNQILASAAAILDTARYDDQDRCAPEHLKVGYLRPFPARLVRVIVFCVLFCPIPVGGNPVEALEDIECPRNLAAPRWWSLRSIPYYLFD